MLYSTEAEKNVLQVVHDTLNGNEESKRRVSGLCEVSADSLLLSSGHVRYREGKGQGWLTGLGETHSPVSVGPTLILLSYSRGLAFCHFLCSLVTTITSGRSKMY